MISIKKCITKNFKYFSILYLITLIVYQFFINNLLFNNEDAMAAGTFELNYTWDISLGRYLVAALKIMFLGVNSEPFNTIISLFLICLSIYIIFSLFGENQGFSIFISMFIITSVINYYILSHRYSSIASSLQLFFATLSVASIIKVINLRLRLLLSITFLVISCALGQYSIAILPITVLFYIINYLIHNKFNLRLIRDLFLDLIVTLVLGLVIYRLTWLLSLKILNIAPANYLGTDKISFFCILLGVPNAFVKSYTIFYQYFSGQIMKFNIYGAYYLYLLFFVFYIVIIVIFSIREKKYELILFAVFLPLLTLPSICSMPIFFTPNYPFIRPHQMLAFTLIIPFIAISLKHILKKAFVLVLILVVLLHCQVLQMSVDFDTMYKSNISTSNIINLILSKLDTMELLDDNYIYFYGSFAKNQLYYTQTFEDKFTKLNKINHRFLIGNLDGYSSWKNQIIRGYIRYYMGVNIKMDLNANFDELFRSKDFLNAKPFPSDESVFVVNGNEVVVKVSE